MKLFNNYFLIIINITATEIEVLENEIASLSKDAVSNK